MASKHRAAVSTHERKLWVEAEVGDDKSPCHKMDLCSGSKITAGDKGPSLTQAILRKHPLASEPRVQHSSNKDLYFMFSKGLSTLTRKLGGQH